MILAKRPRSDAEPKTAGASQGTKITPQFELTVTYLHFTILITYHSARVEVYPNKKHLWGTITFSYEESITSPPALLCQFPKFDVSRRQWKRFPAWPTPLPALSNICLVWHLDEISRVSNQVVFGILSWFPSSPIYVERERGREIYSKPRVWLGETFPHVHPAVDKQ